MGMQPQLQDLLLNWLRGTDMPAPPTLWLSLHIEVPATGLNQALLRSEVLPEDLGTPRNGSNAPLPQEPWVAGDGRLREITNVRQIRSQILPTELTLVSFGLWDAFTGGTMLMNGVLQEPMNGQAGDRLSFQPGTLLLRAVVS